MSVNSKMTAIADNIRDKTGGTDLLTLDDMAEGVNEVFEAGKASMIDQSKIIEKTVSGKIISVDDVSEIPHEVGIQLSSDTVTDFSGVTVKLQSGDDNLFNEKEITTAQTASGATGMSYGFVDNGVLIAKMGEYANGVFWTPFKIILGAGEYTISADVFISTGGAKTLEVRAGLYNPENSAWISEYKYLNAYDTWERKDFKLKISKGAEYYLSLQGVGDAQMYNNMDVRFKNITVSNMGLIDYKPYVEPQTYTSNTDGTVEGITSISPNMTVFTDNADVDISMMYHQSYGAWLAWNRFWDIKQNYGGNGDYYYAFVGSGWTDENFKPKYPIKCITGGCTYMFLYSKVTEINVDIDVSAVTTVPNMFQESTVRYIKKMIFNSKVNTSINAFNNASGLEEVRIEGDFGVSVSFQWSTKLSHDSIVSIITHLSDTATGMTVTFSKTAVNNAFETSSGAADGISSEEWAELIATKSNWTISLV